MNEAGEMSEAASRYGMTVSLLNTLDGMGGRAPELALAAAWPGQTDPVLGPGSRMAVNIVRDLAVARVHFEEAATRRERSRARKELKRAAVAATQFLGVVCLEGGQGYALLTDIAAATKGLADHLISLPAGMLVHGLEDSFPAASAEAALERAERLDAWPLAAVAKALLRMMSVELPPDHSAQRETKQPPHPSGAGWRCPSCGSWSGGSACWKCGMGE